MSQLISKRHHLTKFTWWFLLLNFLLILFFPSITFRSWGPVLTYLGWLLLSTFLVITYLIITYRTFFHAWSSWALSVGFVILTFLFNFGIKPGQPHIALFFSMTLLPSLWILFLATVILLSQNNAGAPLFGWVSILCIWAFFLFWHYRGNFIPIWLHDLTHITEPSSLWWLYSLFCQSSCIIPVALLSFLVQLIRLIKYELR